MNLNNKYIEESNDGKLVVDLEYLENGYENYPLIILKIRNVFNLVKSKLKKDKKVPDHILVPDTFYKEGVVEFNTDHLVPTVDNYLYTLPKKEVVPIIRGILWKPPSGSMPGRQVWVKVVREDKLKYFWAIYNREYMSYFIDNKNK